MKITLIGAGNLGHTTFKHILRRGFSPTLVTSNPKIWSPVVALCDVNDVSIIKVPPGAITDNYDATKDADLIMISSPVSAYEPILRRIKPKPGAAICTTFQAPHIHDATKKMWPDAYGVHLQYVPWQAKIVEPGKSSSIVGRKNYLEYIGNTDWAERISTLLGMSDPPIKKHPLSFILTTSNPILHMPCYYTKWPDWDGTYPSGDWRRWKDPGSLYAQMSPEAAELIELLDGEVQLIQHLIEAGSQEIIGVEPLMQRVRYQYGDQVRDYSSMQSMFNTAKMYNKSSISYMRNSNGALLPDTTSRHFTDDIPYGLDAIKKLALEHGILKTPVLDTMLAWAHKVMAPGTQS